MHIKDLIDYDNKYYDAVDNLLVNGMQDNSQEVRTVSRSCFTLFSSIDGLKAEIMFSYKLDPNI